MNSKIWPTQALHIKPPQMCNFQWCWKKEQHFKYRLEFCPPDVSQVKDNFWYSNNSNHFPNHSVPFALTISKAARIWLNQQCMKNISKIRILYWGATAFNRTTLRKNSILSVSTLQSRVSPLHSTECHSASMLSRYFISPPQGILKLAFVPPWRQALPD